MIRSRSADLSQLEFPLTLPLDDKTQQILFALLSEKDFSQLKDNVIQLQDTITQLTQQGLMENLGLSLLQKGRIEDALGNHKRAQSCYTAVLKEGTLEEKQIAFLNLGNISLKKKSYNDAKKYCKQSIQLGESIYADKARLCLMHMYIMTMEPSLENYRSALSSNYYGYSQKEFTYSMSIFS